jgi:hypothetical protein
MRSKNPKRLAWPMLLRAGIRLHRISARQASRASAFAMLRRDKPGGLRQGRSKQIKAVKPIGPGGSGSVKAGPSGNQGKSREIKVARGKFFWAGDFLLAKKCRMENGGVVDVTLPACVRLSYGAPLNGVVAIPGSCAFSKSTDRVCPYKL